MSHQKPTLSFEQDSCLSENDPELEKSKASERHKDSLDYPAATGGGLRSDGVRWELVPNLKPLKHLIERGGGWKKHVSPNDHRPRRAIVWG